MSYKLAIRVLSHMHIDPRGESSTHAPRMFSKATGETARGVPCMTALLSPAPRRALPYTRLTTAACVQRVCRVVVKSRRCPVTLIATPPQLSPPSDASISLLRLFPNHPRGMTCYCTVIIAYSHATRPRRDQFVCQRPPFVADALAGSGFDLDGNTLTLHALPLATLCCYLMVVRKADIVYVHAHSAVATGGAPVSDVVPLH
ncbi:hypothetical protein BDW22DRAFT_1353517 [Trametopsis cervina]|nr:hypothetical protein BDW22DRAFT_1353517 [Trametopsis cervina]